MTKLDAGLMTSLPASDPGSAAVWGSKRINPRPQSCLCLTWSKYPSNDDDDDECKDSKFYKQLLFCLALTSNSSLNIQRYVGYVKLRTGSLIVLKF